MGLENKTVIVTGAGHGLGKRIALRLAAEGVKVIAADMSMETATATADEINAPGGTARAFAVNIVKRDKVKAMTDFTVEPFSILDVIANNAGINCDTMLHKMTTEQWDQVIAINLAGTFYCVQYATQIIREKGSGAIINISSASWLGNIRQTNYTASKAGVVSLTKTACRKLARKGVTRNAICPGFTNADMTRGIPEKIWNTIISRISMGRAGSPADIANMVVFLTSGGADYITGEVINMGGGMTL